jgi:hypothetical protein
LERIVCAAVLDTFFFARVRASKKRRLSAPLNLHSRCGSHAVLFDWQEGIMTNSVLKSKPDYGFDGWPFGVTIVCLAGVVCFGK